MPRTRLIGTKLFASNDYYETKNSFDKIFNDPKLKNIEKPNEQGSLDTDRVESMINEYNSHPSFLRFKNRIVIGILNDTWYIIDGQHRIEMAKCLFEKKIQDELICCWYTCHNEDDMRYLFNSINRDSTKNQFYIQQSNFIQLNINEFMKLLKKYHNNSFVNQKSIKGYIKSIEELRDDLIKINFFKNQNDIQKLYQTFIQKNNEFFRIVRFKIELDNNPGNFYKNETKYIDDGIIFSLKNTNFIQWLENSNLDPIHRHKKGKKRIAKKLRDECWIQELGNCDTTICPISSCSIQIQKNSNPMNWHAGHIISEYNGGPTEKNNLRPICEKCNLDMGTQNWNDYDI